jgi:hypothetical protein
MMKDGREVLGHGMASKADGAVPSAVSSRRAYRHQLQKGANKKAGVAAGSSLVSP